MDVQAYLASWQEDQFVNSSEAIYVVRRLVEIIRQHEQGVEAEAVTYDPPFVVGDRVQWRERQLTLTGKLIAYAEGVGTVEFLNLERDTDVINVPLTRLKPAR